MENREKPVIFLVEDNEMFSATLKVALEKEGWSVTEFRSGEQMISAWEEDPDIILLDYFLGGGGCPAMDGKKILRFIRRINRSLPVIFLTSNTDIGEATEMLRLGAVDFIVKDEELMPNLKKTITQVLDTVKLRQEMSRNREQIKKYRTRFLIIALMVALAAMTVLWLFS
jgi:CheY-like chemotaxis protein